MRRQDAASREEFWERAARREGVEVVEEMSAAARFLVLRLWVRKMSSLRGGRGRPLGVDVDVESLDEVEVEVEIREERAVEKEMEEVVEMMGLVVEVLRGRGAP